MGVERRVKDRVIGREGRELCWGIDSGDREGGFFRPKSVKSILEKMERTEREGRSKGIWCRGWGVNTTPRRLRTPVIVSGPCALHSVIANDSGR